MKKAIIKSLMKLGERVPNPDSISLNEIFNHSYFIQASKQERQRIMLESSEYRYQYECQHPFDMLFGQDLTPLLKGAVALDLGCFTGGRSVAWAERYQLNKIYGIDVQDIFIEAAQNFADRKNITAEFVFASGEILPFESGIFDAILSLDVFEHVQNIEQVLLECKRVLKTKGKLIVAFPSYFNPIEHHLSMVTLTPFIHYFFNGKDLIEAYNEIIDKRGEEAYWYKRQHRDLEAWERCNTINGITSRKFRSLIKDTNWNIYLKNHPGLTTSMNIKIPLLSLIKFITVPFAKIHGFEEFLCDRIVYILEKP